MIWWAAATHYKLNNVSENLNTLSEKVSTLSESVSRVESDIVKIYALLESKYVSTGRSPVALTSFGERVSRDLSASEWADKYALSIEADVSDMREFEIFELCQKVVEEAINSSEDFESKVKEVSYNHAIDKKWAKEVLAIELRDSVLRLVKPAAKTEKTESTG